MSYCAQQHETDFLITDKEGAEAAAAKAIEHFHGTDSLEGMFDDLGWDWAPHIHGDDLYQNIGKVMSDNDEFFEAIAPFVKEGSYISMVGEDCTIWRWYFYEGKCLRQDGTIKFPDPAESAMEEA